MFTYKTISFLLLLSVAKSDVDFEKGVCKNGYRTLTNNQTVTEKYCSDHLCIEKCCGDGEMFNPDRKCVKTKKMFRNMPRLARLAPEVNYSKIILFSWDGKNKIKSTKDFVFVNNLRSVQNCTSQLAIKNDFFILEDGSIRMQDTGASNSWYDIERLDYCVEFILTKINERPVIKLLVRQNNAPPADDDKKSIFVLVGLLISSFFLILVLLVYCLLPKLQNLIGLVLMAYTGTLLVTFLVKIIMHLCNKYLTAYYCKIISPIMYFAALSSFFWLNVMSFDVWWSLRGNRKRCDINRRGERVKFMWYCLYAWGVPLLITSIVTTLDNIDLSSLNIIKPPFDDCFVFVKSVQLYFILPIGIIIFVNIILFILTVYNIWMIKRSLQRCRDSGKSKQDTHRFVTYIKLSVVMGVGWCLELIPPDMRLWAFIVTNTYNLLIGVAIFFLFVFNKQIYVKLCKRFNIKNDFTKNSEVSQETRSGTTRTTRADATKDQAYEMDLLKNCPRDKSVPGASTKFDLRRERLYS